MMLRHELVRVAHDNIHSGRRPEWMLRFPDRSGTIPDVEPNPSRTNPDELVPLAEAAQRLGIAYDTARKRLKAGTLEGERRGGRWYAWAPEPETRPETGPERRSGRKSEPSGSIPDATEPIPDALVTQLHDEISFLRQQVERQNHIIAGLIQRVPTVQEIAAGEIITVEPEPAGAPDSTDSDNAVQDVNSAPLRDAGAMRAAETLDKAPWPPKSSADSLLLVWRRWWRRMTGNE